jgi:hypothetical protein
MVYDELVRYAPNNLDGFVCPDCARKQRKAFTVCTSQIIIDCTIHNLIDHPI